MSRPKSLLTCVEGVLTNRVMLDHCTANRRKLLNDRAAVIRHGGLWNLESGPFVESKMGVDALESKCTKSLGFFETFRKLREFE